MKINKLLVLAVLSAFGLTANAQTKGPQKNDFNVALTLGYNSSVMGTAVDGTLPSHSIAAKSTNFQLALKVDGFSWMSGNLFWEVV